MSALHVAHSILRPRGYAALAAALLLAALSSVEAVAQGTCAVRQATYRTSENFASTDSTDFVNIPQAALDITVGGAVPTCVIVVFSAQTQTNIDENMGIRARLFGLGSGEPAEVFFGPGTGAVEARAAQFVFEDVPPGTYSLRMQYRSALAGTTVTIGRPTLVVHHR